MALDCTTNLTDANVARRLRVGIVTLALGLGCAIALKLSGASPGVQLLLFIPFFISANVFFQAILMTCGYSALAGMRHTAHGQERIASRVDLRTVRARGIKQIILSFIVAAMITASFLVI